MNPDLTYWTAGDSCCNERWENAYNRFKTTAQADRKFHRRLIRLGAGGWSRNSRVVELFCGSGRNLSCLRKMGFVDLHGVDLSPRLLSLHNGNAKLFVGDATRLIFPDAWADTVIEQGGFHHLTALPGDFEKCLDEIHCILKPEGILVLVEPWLTPFLSFVHWCCRRSFLRKMSGKIDALAKMIEEERLRRAISWKYQYDIVASTPKPKYWLEVRFEDFVLHQEETLSRLEKFLGIPLAKIVVRPESVGRYRLDAGKNYFDFFATAMRDNRYELP
jgi:SAM-dependent methyltransferase